MSSSINPGLISRKIPAAILFAPFSNSGNNNPNGPSINNHQHSLLNNIVVKNSNLRVRSINNEIDPKKLNDLQRRIQGKVAEKTYTQASFALATRVEALEEKINAKLPGGRQTLLKTMTDQSNPIRAAVFQALRKVENNQGPAALAYLQGQGQKKIHPKGMQTLEVIYYIIEDHIKGKNDLKNLKADIENDIKSVVHGIDWMNQDVLPSGQTMTAEHKSALETTLIPNLKKFSNQLVTYLIVDENKTARNLLGITVKEKFVPSNYEIIRDLSANSNIMRPLMSSDTKFQQHLTQLRLRKRQAVPSEKDLMTEINDDLLSDLNESEFEKISDAFYANLITEDVYNNYIKGKTKYDEIEKIIAKKIQELALPQASDCSYSSITQEFIPVYLRTSNREKQDDGLHLQNNYRIEVKAPNILLPENADQFYIRALTNSSSQQEFDWYYQPANEKEKWFKITEGKNALKQYGNSLTVQGSTTKTLFISGASKNYNGIKFKSVSKDSLKTTQVVGVAYGLHREVPSEIVGYKVVNGQLDTTQPLSKEGIDTPINKFRSEPFSGSLGNSIDPSTEGTNIAILGTNDGKPILHGEPLARAISSLQNAASVSMAASNRNYTGILGTDDRNPILNNKQFPYTAIGTTSSGGTAWLVAPNIIVTAAHAVVGGLGHKFFNNLKFRTMVNGKESPGSEYEANVVEVWLDEKWISYFSEDKEEIHKVYQGGNIDVAASFKRRRDWAVLVLEKPVGDLTGYLGCEYDTDYQSHKGSVDIFGYPGDKGGNNLWNAPGNILGTTANPLGTGLDTSANVLIINSDITAGFSGSPIMPTGSHVAIGIATGGNPDPERHNTGTRITKQIFNLIKFLANREEAKRSK